MALSMDEQRMLAEIERHLAAEEPGLATNLASFRKPGRAGVFRSTRARVIGSLFTVAVVAMVSLMVYVMLPFRSGGKTTGHQPVTTSSTSSGPGQAKIGAAPGTGTSTAPAAAAPRRTAPPSPRPPPSRRPAPRPPGARPAPARRRGSRPLRPPTPTSTARARADREPA